MAKRLIEHSWQGFKKMALADVTNEVQITEMRKAFFAGATVLFYALVRGVSEGPEPTEQDEQMLSNIEAELSEFSSQLYKELDPQPSEAPAKSSLEELLSAAAGALAPIKVAGGEFLVAVIPADSARVISVTTGDESTKRAFGAALSRTDGVLWAKKKVGEA